ncbi:MAG: DUF1330 domain-containing protein [Alphaproteobacteria bacterium]|nr:DUF1330 domain-containing protein [Alphaproteobacteria bacterium]
MAKGYWIVHITVTDAENYPKYLAADAIAFEKYQARFLVRGGQFESPEGPARDRHVVIEFDSYAQALACYHSPEYQAAAKLRQAYAESELVIVEGQD